jgi:WD40-like Beta Propeller Repeat
MRDSEFTARLRSGAAELAAAVDPPAPEAIRRRGERRRRRAAAMSGVLAVAVGVGGGGAAYASLGHAGPGAAQPASGSSPASGAVASASAASLPGIVAVTTGGAVEVLNPVTGIATRVLVPRVDAIGDEVSVFGSTVYFAVKRGCADSIESVPLAGGAPKVVTTGVLPSVSPDGTRLAFVREQVSGGPSAVQYGCSGASAGGTVVVVRDLASGVEKAYPAVGGPAPVSHLSWAPSGGAILVSAGPAQGNTGWRLSVLNPATSAAANVPVTGLPDAAKSYYREGVYLPDGSLFVGRLCCTGVPVKVTSTLLQEISGSGRLIRQVAVGYNDRDHTSLAASSGGLLLYLSGHDLFLSAGEGPANKLTSGLIAAAWLPS